MSDDLRRLVYAAGCYLTADEARRLREGVAAILDERERLREALERIAYGGAMDPEACGIVGEAQEALAAITRSGRFYLNEDEESGEKDDPEAAA